MNAPFDLAPLLERVQSATGPDRELDNLIAWHLTGAKFWIEDFPLPGSVAEALMKEEDIPPPPFYTASVDAAISLLETLLPGWWWTCGSCALTNDASVSIPGSNGIGLGHALHAVVGPDFRVSAEMQTLLQEHPHLDRGINVDRVGGNVPLSIIEAILEALISLQSRAAA